MNKILLISDLIKQIVQLTYGPFHKRISRKSLTLNKSNIR